ncbi:hypothetical protein GCM10011415_23240 [Salipiger pallidus]|uniref:Uncharacterized protein n=1 Tax=Salipiger pallidus TaxID=1775170 RepID=A0A8J2ZKI0_9RHOB|nr:hypothetical protein [Salipiger pallidus]GGG74171.1 hypothetical protein GCM10011415_23240 [Salipiger pallidus]
MPSALSVNFTLACFRRGSIPGILIVFASLPALACEAGGWWALMKRKVTVDEQDQSAAVDVPLFGKITTKAGWEDVYGVWRAGRRLRHDRESVERAEICHPD